MRRAGRWQAMKRERRQALFALHKFFEALLGLAAVEEDLRDMRVTREERGEVVRGLVADVSIQAALAHAGGKHIPQGDAGRLQHA